MNHKIELLDSINDKREEHTALAAQLKGSLTIEELFPTAFSCGGISTTLRGPLCHGQPRLIHQFRSLTFVVKDGRGEELTATVGDMSREMQLIAARCLPNPTRDKVMGRI